MVDGTTEEYAELLNLPRPRPQWFLTKFDSREAMGQSNGMALKRELTFATRHGDRKATS